MLILYSFFRVVFENYVDAASRIFLSVLLYINPGMSSTSFIDCLVMKLWDPEKAYLSKIIIALLMPGIKMGITVISIIILKICGKIRKFITVIVVSLTSIFLLEQPSLLITLINYATCFDIGGREFMKDDYGVACDGEIYLYTRDWYVYPGILCWGFVFPLFSFWLIFRRRRDIASVKVRSLFGLMINSYKPSAYYWGFFLMFLRVLVLLVLNVIGS